MQPISSLFHDVPLPPRKKKLSERGELVEYFFVRLYPEWKGKKPLTISYVAFRLSHLKTPDLYGFKSQCEDRERTGYSFSKYFWGSLKPQPWQQSR